MNAIKNYLRKYHGLRKIYRLIMKGPFQNARDLWWIMGQNLRMMNLRIKKSIEIDKMIENLFNGIPNKNLKYNISTNLFDNL